MPFTIIVFPILCAGDRAGEAGDCPGRLLLLILDLPSEEEDDLDGPGLRATPGLPLLTLVLPSLLHPNGADVALPPASAPSEGGPLIPVPVPGKSIATEPSRAGGEHGPPVCAGGDGVDGAPSAPPCG